eukprot:8202197-Lingulodinium_polyedra.AAC.1
MRPGANSPSTRLAVLPRPLSARPRPPLARRLTSLITRLPGSSQPGTPYAVTCAASASAPCVRLECIRTTLTGLGTELAGSLLPRTALSA